MTCRLFDDYWPLKCTTTWAHNLNSGQNASTVSVAVGSMFVWFTAKTPQLQLSVCFYLTMIYTLWESLIYMQNNVKRECCVKIWAANTNQNEFLQGRNSTGKCTLQEASLWWTWGFYFTNAELDSSALLYLFIVRLHRRSGWTVNPLTPASAFVAQRICQLQIGFQ